MTARKDRTHVAMIVVVSVPRGFSAYRARKEVRHLINDQCNFILDPGDVRVVRIGANPKFKRATKNASPPR